MPWCVQARQGVGESPEISNMGSGGKFKVVTDQRDV